MRSQWGGGVYTSGVLIGSAEWWIGVNICSEILSRLPDCIYTSQLIEEFLWSFFSPMPPPPSPPPRTSIQFVVMWPWWEGGSWAGGNRYSKGPLCFTPGSGESSLHLHQPAIFPRILLSQLIAPLSVYMDSYRFLHSAALSMGTFFGWMGTYCIRLKLFVPLFLIACCNKTLPLQLTPASTLFFS